MALPSSPFFKRLRGLVIGAVLFAMPMSAMAQDIKTGLVGHWKLDEMSGSAITDSGTGNTNGTWSDGSGDDVAQETEAGVIGGALHFDGDDDVVDVSGANYLTNTNTVTITAWIKPQSFGAADGIVHARTGVNDAIGIYYENSFTTSLSHTWGGNFAFDYGLTPPLNEWSFIAMVVEPTQITMYMREAGGTLQSSVNTGFSPPLDTLDNLTIGRDTSSVSRFFDGSIDDVRVYNRSLTAEDIAVLASGTVEGSIRYNNQSEAVEYHEGVDWVHAGLGSYSPNAVAFDGASDYLNTTDLGISHDGYSFTFSLWFKRSNSNEKSHIFQSVGPGTRVGFENGDQIRVNGSVSGSTVFSFQTTTTITDTDWHHLLVSMDSRDSANKWHIYIDDVQQPLSIATDLGSLLDFTDDLTVGARNDGGSRHFFGDMADFWLSYNTYIDLSVEANRRKFISPQGLPMYLGPDGSLPLGKTPDVFLSGDTDDWHLNKGTGGDFTESGALTTAETAPSEYPAFTATLLGTLSGIETPQRAKLLGDYVYLTSNLGSTDPTNGALYVVDISDPTTPAVVGSVVDAALDDANRLHVAYPIVYVAVADGVTAVDVSSPTSPSIAGNLTDATNMGDVRSLNVHEGVLYALNTSPHYLHSIDITDLSSMSIIDSIGADNPYEDDLYIYDDHAFVGASNKTGLNVFDISDPANLSLAGDISAIASRCHTYQGTSYCIDRTNEQLFTVDVSDPANPTLIRDYGANSFPFFNNSLISSRRSHVDGKYLYTPDNDGSGGRGINIWDISDPSNVFLAGTNYTLGIGLNITDSDNRYVIAVEDFSARLRILEVNPCASPDGARGDIIYNTDENVMQYCNGVDWVAMGPVGGTGGGGCASPTGVAGDLVYNERFSVLQYCNSEDWVGVGEDDYFANAVQFDGPSEADYLSDTSLTGIADSKSFTLSFWVKFDSVDARRTVYFSGDGSGNGIDVRIGADERFRLNSENAADVTVYSSTLDSANAVVAGQWYHMLYSVDLTDSNKNHIYMNDVDVTPTPTTFTDDVIDFTRSGHYIGSSNTGSNRMHGGIADLWLEMGTYIDLSVEENRRKFISADGKPVNLGTDGSKPTGQAPDVFLSGDTATWHTNKGTSSGFTENGTLSDASTTPN